jgi:hypothetical protein
VTQGFNLSTGASASIAPPPIPGAFGGGSALGSWLVPGFLGLAALGLIIWAFKNGGRHG